MNSNYKYRHKTIDEFVFANEELESRIKRYTDEKTILPLVLCGKHGTGKSLLAELIPKAISKFLPQSSVTAVILFLSINQMVTLWTRIYLRKYVFPYIHIFIGGVAY